MMILAFRDSARSGIGKGIAGPLRTTAITALRPLLQSPSIQQRVAGKRSRSTGGRSWGSKYVRKAPTSPNHYSGHAALVGTREFRWQATEEVLVRFGAKVSDARRKYRAFVAEGRTQGRRSELMGGGLVRSTGGWAAVRELRHGRESYASDERILGGTEFVLSVLKELEKHEVHRRSRRGRDLDAVSLIEQIAKAEGMTPERIRGAGRPRDVSRVREGIAHLWVECLGGSGRALACELGLRPESVNQAARRWQEQSEYWQKMLGV